MNADERGWTRMGIVGWVLPAQAAREFPPIFAGRTQHEGAAFIR